MSVFLLWIFLERNFVHNESVWHYFLVPIVVLPILLLVSYSFLNGKTSTVAPLSYLQLPVAAVYGLLIFNEAPETKTYYGAFLIILAGLILVLFSNKNKGHIKRHNQKSSVTFLGEKINFCEKILDELQA